MMSVIGDVTPSAGLGMSSSEVGMGRAKKGGSLSADPKV